MLAVLAVLALKADATLAPHSSPVPRSQPPPALAFSPFLKFLPSRPHSSPSHTCSSVLRPRWTRAALLRTGKASGAVLLAAKVRPEIPKPVADFCPGSRSAGTGEREGGGRVGLCAQFPFPCKGTPATVDSSEVFQILTLFLEVWSEPDLFSEQSDGGLSSQRWRRTLPRRPARGTPNTCAPFS